MIQIDLLAEPTIGMNMSGMHTQLNFLFEGMKSIDDISMKKYDIWKQIDADLIHVFGASESLLNTTQAFNRYAIPYIVSPNHLPRFSMFIENFLSNVGYKNIIYTNRFQRRKMLQGAEKIVVNSMMEKEIISKVFDIDENKFIIIHNSYGDNKINNNSSFLTKYNINNEYCLCVGQIGSERKNQLELIKNWPTHYPDLVLIGGIDKTAYGKKCIDFIEKKENVISVGFIGDSKLIDSAYFNAKMFIAPGLVETPGLSTMRALLHGTKVATTNGGATKEYFGDLVEYFDPKNMESMFFTIDFLLKNKKQMDNKEFIKKYSEERILNNYLNLYKEIYEKKS